MPRAVTPGLAIGLAGYLEIFSEFAAEQVPLIAAVEALSIEQAFQTFGKPRAGCGHS
jgi:hypothetical protein